MSFWFLNQHEPCGRGRREELTKKHAREIAIKQDPSHSGLNLDPKNDERTPPGTFLVETRSIIF